MSHNLELGDARAKIWFDLYQTPTDLTRRAIASDDPKAVYFTWLDKRVAEKRPHIHPRAGNAIKKRIMSSEEWKDYEHFAEVVRDHKARIEQFLNAHPNARWYSN